MNPEQYLSRERALSEKILERAAEDDQFRQQLLDDPEGALQQGGLDGDIEELQESLASLETDDVQGHWTIVPVRITIYAVGAVGGAAATAMRSRRVVHPTDRGSRTYYTCRVCA